MKLCCLSLYPAWGASRKQPIPVNHKAVGVWWQVHRNSGTYAAEREERKINCDRAFPYVTRALCVHVCVPACFCLLNKCVLCVCIMHVYPVQNTSRWKRSSSDAHSVHVVRMCPWQQTYRLCWTALPLPLDFPPEVRGFSGLLNLSLRNWKRSTVKIRLTMLALVSIGRGATSSHKVHDQK